MKKLLFFLLLSTSISSCATILSGHATVQNANGEITRGEWVTFQSKPSHAEVHIDGHFYNYTPCKYVLACDKNHYVKIQLDNYITEDRVIISQMQGGWVVADILFGILPLFIDAMTGDWNFLLNTNINVELAPASIEIKRNTK